MKILIVFAVFVFSFSVVACSPSCTHGATKKEKTEKETVEKKEKTEKAAVKNVIIFEVPEKQQKLMGLKTAKLSKNDKGSVMVPNVCIQEINGKTVILLSLGDNKFALREIKVDEKQDKNSLVTKNINEGETVITDGAAKLKAGVERMMSGHHHGHTHGPGGHTH